MVHGTHNALDDPRNASIQIWIDGELKARDEAKISVFDSGFLVGDGVWEGLRLHRGVLVFLEEHLDRLWQGAAAIGLEFDFTRAELVERIERTLAANAMTDGVHVRVMVTRGTKKTPSQDPRLVIGGPNLVIIAHPECPPEVLDEADYVGSTSGMINYVGDQQPKRVVMVTECSMSDNVAVEYPDVNFVRPCNLCPHMKRMSLPKIYYALEKLEPQVEVDPDIAARARRSLERMLEVGRGSATS